MLKSMVFVEDKYRPLFLANSYPSFILQTHEAIDEASLLSLSTNLLFLFLFISYCFIID